MNDFKKIDESIVGAETTEDTVQTGETKEPLMITVYEEIERIRTCKLYSPIPTQKAEAFFVITEHEKEELEPTEAADLKTRITDVSEPEPRGMPSSTSTWSKAKPGSGFPAPMPASCSTVASPRGAA